MVTAQAASSGGSFIQASCEGGHFSRRHIGSVTWAVMASADTQGLTAPLATPCSSATDRSWHFALALGLEERLLAAQRPVPGETDSTSCPRLGLLQKKARVGVVTARPLERPGKPRPLR